MRQEREKEQAAAQARATQEQQERERLANARGGVLVRTLPAGATVTLGGEDLQPSPAAFKSLHLGTYPLTIKLDGYEPVTRQVEVKEKAFADLGTVELGSEHGRFAIEQHTGRAGV